MACDKEKKLEILKSEVKGTFIFTFREIYH